MAAPEVGALARVGSRAPETEARLAMLARAGGPLRRTSAALAGRLVAAKSWERLGYARLGDYARERLGVSARTLQDLARVDRGLAELPRLEAALVSGELPWSKVRLLARFATPADEARWIATAQRVSVHALERQVRRVDRGALEAGGLECDEEGGDPEPVERIRIRGAPAMCFQWQRTREYAARVAGGPVTPGTVLEMVTAETLSALRLDADAETEASPAEGVSWSEAVEAQQQGDARNDSCEEEDGASAMATARHGAVALHPPLAEDTPAGAEPGGEPALDATSCALPIELPAFLQPLVAGLANADAFELDARLRRVVRLEQRLDAELAPLLRQVTVSEFEWRGRYRTLAAYAREQLGMSPRKARALLRLERVGDVCPELRAAYRDGSLSWVQAQALAPLLLGDAGGGDGRRGAWVAFAPRVSVRRLQAVVDRALLVRETDPGARALALDPARIDAELGPSPDAERQTCARNRESGGTSTWWERWPISVTAPRDVARLFRAALCTVRRARERETGRLPSEGEAFGAMLDHALASWGADDPRLRRRLAAQYKVFERDGWRCTVPGCTSRRNLHAHHLKFRSAGGTDALANQTTLCAWHHLRGVHAGLVRIRGTAPGALAFELGVRPGRPPLARYGPGERVA